ncbi:MAG: hypothetical protein H7096_00370 [Flavobacterium sp.]|nr:hypothetical protein [Pedobacter sp.]
MEKPITLKTHGLIDYALSGVQLFGPMLLGLNNRAGHTYQALGSGFLGINTLTKTSVGIKKLIPIRHHKKADAVFLGGLALLTATSMIRKDRKALGFHLVFLSLATANYFLTDYKKRK